MQEVQLSTSLQPLRQKASIKERGQMLGTGENKASRPHN
jgi:hypothetical protein